jgi:hypothetical protein
MIFLYVGLALVGGYLVITGLIALGTALLSLLVVPFAILSDLTKWMTKTRSKDRVKKVLDELDRKERETNAKLEALYFPKSGELDENGIPYL